MDAYIHSLPCGSPPGAETPEPPTEVVVAAANSRSFEKKAADLVCTGTNDEAVINEAIARLTYGGTLRLADGDYFIDAFPNEGNSAIFFGYDEGLTRVVTVKGTTEGKIYGTYRGASLHVTKRAMDAMAPDGVYRVFFGAGRIPEGPGDTYTYTHVNNVNFTNFRILFHDASKPLIGIDGRHFGSMELDLVGVYTERYFPDRYEHLKPATPAKGSIGVYSLPGSNDESARNRYNKVCVGGLHTGFVFDEVDHLVMTGCMAARCVYGYWFERGSPKTTTMLNCCDEGNAHLPHFRGRGHLTAIDFNVERFNAAFVPDDPDGDEEPAATEEQPGGWSGFLSYTLQGTAYGLGTGNWNPARFWRAGDGGNIRTFDFNAAAREWPGRLPRLHIQAHDKGNTMNPVIPFFAITGRPTDADLARKVAALRADGFDQFLIYARSGLQYKYMGEEWLHAVETLCREAERSGMKVWLYDEYNWPSGTCKGRVPAADERFRYSEWALYPKPDGGFRWEIVQAPAGWVNVCEPKAVRLFMRMTHEVYEKRLAHYFASKTILGIFTDEPGHPVAIQLEPDCRAHFRRWTGMEDEYRAETGRDFRADVEGALAGGSAEVWPVYTRLMGRRFRSAYFDQIRAWCERMGVLLTGHLINESELAGACRFNGDPLLALKGESLPGIDEIFTNASWENAAHGGITEWLTLATAQHATSRNGRGGLVELYACGPNDMTAARMRQMVWFVALHGIDHYLACMQVVDERGLVEKHIYLSPLMEGQPWHGELADFFAEAKRASCLARRQDTVHQVAVRYPRREGSLAALAGWKRPPVEALLRELDGGQISVDLLAEDETSDLPVVFEPQGEEFVDAKSGRVFSDMTDAARWAWEHATRRIRFYEQDGAPAKGLVVREWSDGTLVALDLLCRGPRRLTAVSGDVPYPCEIPARGVLVLGPGERPSAPPAPGTPLKFGSLAYALDRDPVYRLPFAADGVARFTVAEGVGGVRLVLRTCAMSYAVTASGRPVDDGEGAPPNEQVLRHDAVPYRFELDGKPLAAEGPCTSLPIEFRPLYAETAPLELAPGEHVLRLVAGEPDVNYFLPAAFAAGAFAEKDGVLSPLPATLSPGAIAEQGLAGFCGAVTYVLADVELPKGAAALELDVGNAFVRVRWNGTDLGTRAWAPYTWPLPTGAAPRGRLEATVYTHVWNIFGDRDRPGANWDMKFWNPQHDSETAPGLFTARSH